MNLVDIIIAPIVTEKSMTEASKGKYTFRVLQDADKASIKKAIEQKFKVNVVKISTSVTKKRKTRMGARRVQTINSYYKKATVALKEGQKIGVFDTGTK